MTYSLFGGEQLGAIDASLTNGASSLTSMFPEPDAGSEVLTISDVPAGTGYSLVLTSTTVDGLSTCSGSVGVTLDGGLPGGGTFDVSAGATTPVSVEIVCYETTASGCASAPAGACPPGCYLNQVVQAGGSLSAPTCSIMPEECVPGGGAWSVSARGCGVGVGVDYLDGGSVPQGAFCCTYELAVDGGPDAQTGGDP